jgi:hypothetical protein
VRVTALPTRFLGIVTRTQLAEMLAQTYATAKNIDPNEAYTRLDASLKQLRLIEGIQRGIWSALEAKKPNLSPQELVELVAKKLDKKKFKALKPKRAEEGPLAALTILIDMGAQVSSGEAMDLLDRAEGEKLLREGFRIIGAHIASEMLR